MFDKKGVIVIEDDNADEDELMMSALDAGAEDFSSDNGIFEIVTSPDSFTGVCDALESGTPFVSPVTAGITCLRISAAIYLSSYLGKAVQLDDLSLYDSFIEEKLKEERKG